jgi:putative ABC transport system permease protein
MIRNYIKLAFRSLLKNKGFTIINVLGLAFGLAACRLIVFYVVDELSYDRYNTRADKIYRVNADIKYGGNASSYAITPPPLATALQSFPEVSNTVRLLHDGGLRIKLNNENIQEDNVVYSDASLFNIFTLPLIAGDAKTALKDPNCMVITARTANKYFKTTQVVGRVLTVNNSIPFKITGVMADIPAQSHFDFDFFVSLSTRDEAKSTNWLNYVCNTYILLKPGAAAKNVEAKFPALMRTAINNLPDEADMNMERFEKLGNYFKLNLTPLTDIHLSSNRRYELGANSSLQYVYIFSAIAIFILLLACINFVNLSTARSSTRAREVGVRKVLGSPRKYLIAQFICESVLLTLFATLIAGLIAWLAMPLFNQISGKNLVIDLGKLIYGLPLLVAVALAVGILAGAYPAFFLSAFQPVNVLKGKLTMGFKGVNLRSFLITMQFAVSIFLVIGTLVIYNQLNYIQNRDLGFDRNQVLTIKNTGVLNNAAEILKQEIKQLPGVTNVTLSSFLPTGKNRNPDAVFANKVLAPKNALFTEIWTIDEDYLNTIGMKVLKGRNFDKRLSTDSSGILVNEAAAKMLGLYNNPAGRKLYRPLPGGTKEYNVLGMIKDFNFNTLRDNITPVVMVLGKDNRELSIRLNTNNLAATLGLIRQKWDNLSTGEHFDYSFMDEDFDAAYRTEQRTGTLFLGFTVLAIFIACLGLFGLTAYAAEQRSKEISIRKVLGANVAAIVALLSKDLLKLISIAIATAVPLAWLIMQKWLQGFAYRQDIRLWMLALACLGSLLVGFLTISLQSVTAALQNPVKNLKND